MKLFVGVVSKNTVDAVIEYANEYNIELGLIPSRRQVDFDAGYVNDWTTKTLSEYVKELTDKVIIERDHGGEDQGYDNKNHYTSYTEDVKYFDAIHVDPWKSSSSTAEVIRKTIYNLEFCYAHNKKLWFEVGTEEAITRMDDVELWEFLHGIEHGIDVEIFKRIKYVVVQSGTRLHETSNIGEYEEFRMLKMIGVAHEFGLDTKIHNGDYLSIHSIREHYDMGIDAINIAPEFGYIETKEYLRNMNDVQVNKFYRLCRDSGQWKKWVDNTFDVSRKRELIEICGHYVFSTDKFQEIKKELDPKVDEIIKNRIKDRIGNILDV